MIYPFWMMIAGSLTGRLDYKDRALIPGYLRNDDELFVRFLTSRYKDLTFLGHTYELQKMVRATDFRGNVEAPVEIPFVGGLADWRQFLKEGANAAYLTPANPDQAISRYQDFLQARFSASIPRGMSAKDWTMRSPIERMNQLYHQNEEAFAFVSLPPWEFGQVLSVRIAPIYPDFSEFLQETPASDLLVIDGGFLWETWKTKTGADPAQPFSAVPPRDAKARATWETFVDDVWPASLRKGSNLISAESDWHHFLRSKYGNDAALATAWQEPGVTLDSAPLLHKSEDAFLFIGQTRSLRWRMMTENYVRVGRFLWERGRAIQNTVILVGLSILVALVLNPLAAYGLSRYPGKPGKISLVFLVMTIAFPMEVAMIPSFLLLRDLSLLNTFAALILPSAVSGFSIFLLKGFFDGLPEELFECARMEGASDWELFLLVAVPLSKPILAVIALGTFTATYGGYMWALLVCQDSRMWTLMVWLFQFYQTFSAQPWLGMAAFVMASVPTLLVFIFCQRIILRGIIIPTEK